jgi:predicted dehydrogenase
MKVFNPTITLILILMAASCSTPVQQAFTGADQEVRLITLNPGHFHAALVQKEMFGQVDPNVYIYSPGGADLDLHMQRINRFNQRSENPTNWQSHIYTGEDYLERMLEERNGNVVIIAGNNRLKTSYIMRSVDAGYNVLSDKPMAIDIESFRLLQAAFSKADENNVLLYDIMTERYDITSRLQREIALIPSIFGTLEKGTAEDPSVVKESVHHFFKYVSGAVLQRPPWYFDVAQQGEGIVDVTTHLVDLVQWVCFPDRIINYQTDIDVYDATRFPTPVTRQQFLDVTRLDEIPSYLGEPTDEQLYVYANGEMQYSLNDVHVKVSVVWDYAAPEGGGDTHYSLMKGTKSHLVIRQGREQNFLPMLYMIPAPGQDRNSWNMEVESAFAAITEQFPGILAERSDEGFVIQIPTEYRIGHEAHFTKVAEKYLRFLVNGKLPEWEVPNMISKYYTTTRAWEIAHQKSATTTP